MRTPENGILFAHRVSRHYSSSYSAFYLLYNREPTLPVDVKYDLEGHSMPRHSTPSYPPVKVIRDEVHEDASRNISKAQEKQKWDYNRRHSLPCPIKVGDNVLLKNNKKEYRKGGSSPINGLVLTLYAIYPKVFSTQW